MFALPNTPYTATGDFLLVLLYVMNVQHKNTYAHFCNITEHDAIHVLTHSIMYLILIFLLHLYTTTHPVYYCTTRSIYLEV
jgi:hypothetical protein